MEHLTLQIGCIDHVEVHDTNASHAGRSRRAAPTSRMGGKTDGGASRTKADSSADGTSFATVCDMTKSAALWPSSPVEMASGTRMTSRP